MALIGCPECGQRISETAESCLGCGYILAPGQATEIKELEAQEREKRAQDSRKGNYYLIGCGFFVLIIMLMNYVRCY